MNLTPLELLVSEDFGYKRSGSRWGRSETHSSLVVDSEKQCFYFNAEGKSGSTLDYLLKVRGMSKADAEEFLLQLVGYSDAYVHHYFDQKEVITYPPLADSFHDVGKLNRDYFYRRGLTDNTIDRFNLGWFADFYSIPIYENDLLRNIQLRRDIPTKSMYHYYKHAGVSLFNSDILKLCTEVFWTEGPVDAMAFIQNEGVPVIASDSGGAFNENWLSRFSHIKKIWICFDNDSAGNLEAKRVAKFFGIYRCKIYNMWDFDTPGYDPVDFFRENNKNLYELIKERARYSFEL